MENEYTSPWQQPVEHLRALTAAGEELLRHSADQAGEEFHRAKAHFDGSLSNVRQSIAAMEATSLRKVKIASAKADLYVQEHPWQAVSYGAAAAGLAGVILGWLLSRQE
jgi:ElaB/YqjD/DUF883 family membrane-anchored ribosome-binding protein